ncbi:non-classical arabinogalactan protein 30 [Chenopodium quinoa]|uniref:non-classical arabinogalactan protein 30 n=1 Tax=Chenopodium quinoa TaxID=63459 RepID=UPI000B79A40D|nr:non-classical arabinogalactan protein 30 [Chenopodium quinoa]
MGNFSLPHALFLSLLVLSLATTSFTATTDNNELNTLPYALPSSAPATAPTHHQHHTLSPSSAPTHHHHHHHNKSHSPSSAPAHAPAAAPTHHHQSHSPASAPTSHHYNHSHSHSPASAPTPHHHHQHHHNKSHSPAAAPAHSPAKSPSYPPTKAPVPVPVPAPAPHHVMPPRKLVAVEGVVYCKNCSYSGVATLTGASPLSGARVELRCRNTKYMIKKESTTDKNGFFFLEAPKLITTYGAHKCKVYLLEKPNNSGACSHATNLNGGISGAFLFFNKTMAPPPKPLPYSLFTVGPFAFEPSKCYKH